jgi:LacI family transcriptional regulator
MYVASGLMALGAMRAMADLSVRCPEDMSLASTDTIPGIGGLRPRLNRSEDPVTEMVNEALRLLVDRIERNRDQPPRNVVFQSALVVGESCAPIQAG